MGVCGNLRLLNRFRTPRTTRLIHRRWQSEEQSPRTVASADPNAETRGPNSQVLRSQDFYSELHAGSRCDRERVEGHCRDFSPTLASGFHRQELPLFPSPAKALSWQYTELKKDRRGFADSAPCQFRTAFAASIPNCVRPPGSGSACSLFRDLAAGFAGLRRSRTRARNSFRLFRCVVAGDVYFVDHARVADTHTPPLVGPTAYRSNDTDNVALARVPRCENPSCQPTPTCSLCGSLCLPPGL